MVASVGNVAHEQQRDGEQVAAGQRAEERRHEPARVLALAQVEHEVLGQARRPVVVETELVPIPARRARLAPPVERHRVQLHDPADRKQRRDADDRVPEAAELAGAETERAPERVRQHRHDRVPETLEDALGARLTVEHRLRQDRIDDDHRCERQGERVHELRSKRQAARPDAHREESDHEQDLLPRRDRVEREPAHARLVQRRHDDVVDGQAEDEQVERDHGPPPHGHGSSQEQGYVEGDGENLGAVHQRRGDVSRLKGQRLRLR